MIATGLMLVAGVAVIAVGAKLRQAMEASEAYTGLRDAMGAAGHEGA